MLRSLRLENVGPAPTLEIELSPRVNLITGDNGLGKSFILDVAWWAMTRSWAGYMALPDRRAESATIRAAFQTERQRDPSTFSSDFDRTRQSWRLPTGRPANPGMVLYAQVDGGFSVWDPARNRAEEGGDLYRFSPEAVWDGTDTQASLFTWKDRRPRYQCNGLIRDWASWQRERGESFAQLCSVLERLSPDPAREPLRPGALTRISLDDARDMPTLRTPYGQEVAVVHASAAIRRVLALAYLLVWSWREHALACSLLGRPLTRQITFLIDEIEAHLHPSWQRRILRALMDVVRALSAEVEVQIVAVTHSPMLLASMEPVFDPEKDALWAFDLVDGQVRLERQTWRRRGDANRWLTSEVFDLPEPRSWEAEQAIRQARELMAGRADLATYGQVYSLLRRSMPGIDPFWIEWRSWAWRHGLIGQQA